MHGRGQFFKKIFLFIYFYYYLAFLKIGIFPFISAVIEPRNSTEHHFGPQQFKSTITHMHLATQVGPIYKETYMKYSYISFSIQKNAILKYLAIVESLTYLLILPFFQESLKQSIILLPHLHSGAIRTQECKYHVWEYKIHT